MFFFRLLASSTVFGGRHTAADIRYLLVFVDYVIMYADMVIYDNYLSHNAGRLSSYSAMRVASPMVAMVG